jgi:dihydroorotase
MGALLLKGGRVIDPASGLDATTDVLIRDDAVISIGDTAASNAPADVVVWNAGGLVISPGLIDLHVHFREPGQTKKEDIHSGARCAARGGFTTVVCMPNTRPAIDNAGAVALIQDRGQTAAVRVEVAGALTLGIAGEEMAPVGSLAKAGVVALTDDGHCIQNGELMRRACEYARMFGLPIMDHCQDYGLVTEGVMNEGRWSALLGLRGWPSAGEEVIVARNILLAELTGAPIHCQHVSAAGSVRLIREAKARGVPISGEACPHHFVLTDAAIAGSSEYWREDGAEWARSFFPLGPAPHWPSFDANFKMNPPLRTAADREAVLAGLADGTLEILASDHAPHTVTEKEVEFDKAPFGIVGLEVELALSLMALHHSNRISLSNLLAKFTVNPARFLGLKDGRGRLAEGGPADVTVFDPNESWVSTAQDTASKSRNNPFAGWTMLGRPAATIVRGQVAWQSGRFPAF